jgi:histone H3/H4
MANTAPTAIQSSDSGCLYTLPGPPAVSCIKGENSLIYWDLEATVQKIISEILVSRPGYSFAKDARDLLIDCSVEFITLISSEANDIAEREAKKTIAAEHVTKALEELGFEGYVPEIKDEAAEHKEKQKVCTVLCLAELRLVCLLGLLCRRRKNGRLVGKRAASLRRSF